MEEFISPAVKRILDLQAKYNRELPKQKIAYDLALSLKGINPPRVKSFMITPRDMHALGGVSFDPPWGLASQLTTTHTQLAPLPKQLQALGMGVPSSRLLSQLMGTPIVSPFRGLAEIQLREAQGFIRAEKYAFGRASWITDFSSSINQFIEKVNENWRRIEEQNKEIDKATEEIVAIFLKEGWYVLPVLYFSDYLLPISLSQAVKNNIDDAKRIFISAFIDCKEELLGYVIDKINGLGLSEAVRDERCTSIERQLDLACEGENVDGIASFMVAEAEGLFNDVTEPLGLEQGCFYTSDAKKIEHRKKILDSWHDKIEKNDALFEEMFTRRHYKMFTRTRAGLIPKRDQMQHGRTGFRQQEHAIWATTFLILTIEYLDTLVKLNSGT